MTDLPNLDALEAVARAATPDGELGSYTFAGVGKLQQFQSKVSPTTVLALITRLREAERHNVQLLREAVKREGRVRRAEGAIAEALNHDPLHGRKEGIHCGGMAPCISDALTAYKPTSQEGES